MERVRPRLRPAASRSQDFGEVSLGLTSSMAVIEASRCLECAKPVCVEGCPVGVRIDEFVRCVAHGDISGAARIIHDDNVLPGVCGRVCPQELQCEGACVMAKKGRPIAIGYLERFVADAERTHAMPNATSVARRTGRRVAVVGSGPSGLACASDLASMGHDVTVFEALHELGGVLAYGIPSFRLPREIVRAEIEQLEHRGVTFETDVLIGSGTGLDDLIAEGFESVFVGAGAGLPRFLDVPGEGLVGVFSANEFLTRVNLMGASMPDGHTPVFDVSHRPVVVIGGGNTALDAARTAVRLGGAPVEVVYRRTEHAMPARVEEIAHARDEGISFMFLASPIHFEGESGRLDTVVVQKMRLGESDAHGRPRPEPIDGAIERLAASTAIVAIGNTPNPILVNATPTLASNPNGTIVTDPDTGATSIPGVFAGGDIATGGATVIQALGAGRRSARAIDSWLRGCPPVRATTARNPAVPASA